VHRRLLCSALAALVWLSSPGLVSAEEARDAAVRADQVNQEHCADLYSERVERAASAMVAVADVWRHVDAVYRRTGEPYLLYWRGVLAQCLRRDEAATEDLQSFAASQTGSAIFDTMARDARARLRRLARVAGGGAAERYLRRYPALEIAGSYGAGGGAHLVSCADDGTLDEGESYNSRCFPGERPTPVAVPAAVPALAQASVTGFPGRHLGLGAEVRLAVPAPSGLPGGRSPGPLVQVFGGGQLRVGTPIAAGRRAATLRVQLRVAASFGRLSPMAGSKYPERQGFLDAGSYALRHVGPDLALEGAFEVGPRLVLSLSGRVTWFAPLGPDATPQVIGPSPAEVRYDDNGTEDDPSDDPTRDEEVEILPELTRSSQLGASLRAALLVPHASEGLAVGPFIELGWHRSSIRFPDDRGDVWWQCDDCVGDWEARKVYSTRRDDLFIAAGVELRFSAGARRPQPADEG